MMAVAAAVTAGARTLGDLFCVKDSVVDEVFPYLDYNARMDMVDYHRAGLDAVTRDVMYNSEVRLTNLTDSVLRLHSDNLDVDVAMFTARGDTIITVVRTLGLGGGDSDVAVYDTSWRPLGNAFVAPEYSDWLVRNATKIVDSAMLVATVPYVTWTAESNPGTGELTLTNTAITTPGMDKAVVAVFLPEIVYSFDGKKFKLR